MSQSTASNDPSPFMMKIRDVAMNAISDVEAGFFVMGHIEVKHQEAHRERVFGVRESQHLATVIEIYLFTQAGADLMAREEEQSD